MKLLLVDLDGIAFGWANKPALQPLPKPFHRLQARASELLTQRSDWRSWLRQDGAPNEVIAVGALNTVTMRNWSALGSDWPGGVCAAIAAVAEALGLQQQPRIELAVVQRAPETADAALIALLQHSPWQSDDVFSEVIVASRDYDLRSEITRLLPASLRGTAVKTGGSAERWIISGGWRRRGAGQAVPRPGREIAAGWSAAADSGLPQEVLASFCDLNHIEVGSADRFAAQIKSHAHVVTQIGVSDRGVCGVARLARILCGHGKHALFWCGGRDYMELSTLAHPPSGNLAEVGPVHAAATGSGTLRFVGGKATVTSRYPLPLWALLSNRCPQVQGLAAGPNGSGTVANDKALESSAGLVNSEQWTALLVSLGRRPRDRQTPANNGSCGETQRGNDQLVVYAPTGWWWTERHGSKKYLRTGLPIGLVTGGQGVLCLARPAWDSDGLYLGPHLPPEAHWRSETNVRKGCMGRAVDAGGTATKNVLFLARADIDAAQPISLRGISTLSESSLMRLFPDGKAWLRRLRRAPIAIATPIPLSDSPAASVLH